MEYRYTTLTTVQFRHGFFAGNRYTGFTVEPDAATLHQFKRLSILFKPAVDGFTLLFETGPGLERTRAVVLKEQMKFSFRINNSDPDFLNYTDGLPDNITDVVLFFQNRVPADPAQPGEGRLHENMVFSVKDILHNRLPENSESRDRVFFNKPFGWLEINLHEALEPLLTVSFKGKETLWRYILNSEHLQELTEPAVIHKDTKEAFEGPVWIVLPDGKKRMAFESRQMIPLSSKPEKVFQLVENYQPGSGRYKVVMSVLPNPNVKLISLIRSEKENNENKFSEIFI